MVGEILPAAHVERVLRQYYSGELGDVDLEERLLRGVDESQFRSICQHALEGLAAKKLNLEMLIERRARAQERRVVPETIARFLLEAAPYAGLAIKELGSLPHAFDPGKTPSALRAHEQDADWRLPALANQYPRCTTDRKTADEKHLEWVTPGHPLFEAVRRQVLGLAREPLSHGACYYSLQHEQPARIDLYRARVVDGLGRVIHERLFAVELNAQHEPGFCDPAHYRQFHSTVPPEALPSVANQEEATTWLLTCSVPVHRGSPRRAAGRSERIAEHNELSLTELLSRRMMKSAARRRKWKKTSRGRKVVWQGGIATRGLLARRDRRRRELEQQRSLTLQAVDVSPVLLVCLTRPGKIPKSVGSSRISKPKPRPCKTVWLIERSQGRVVDDVHEKNLGYDLTSIDPNSGDTAAYRSSRDWARPRATSCSLPMNAGWPEDRRIAYWLYVVANCDNDPELQNPIKDSGRISMARSSKVQHYWLEVDTMTRRCG